MPSALPHVALIPALVSAIIMVVIGTLWYSPFLFGKAWIRHTGIRATDIRPGEAQRGRIVSIVTALIMAYLIGLIAAHVGHSVTLFWGVALIWIFVIIEQLGGVLWRRDPIALFFLQAFRSLFAFMGGALVFYFWS